MGPGKTLESEKAMQPKIIDLQSLAMGQAYDFTQYGPVRHGDVVLVADGVAVMFQAWPVMVAGASDVFHRLTDGATWHGLAAECRRPGEAEQLLAGVALAARPLADLAARAVDFADLADLAV